MASALVLGALILFIIAPVPTGQSPGAVEKMPVRMNSIQPNKDVYEEFLGRID